ncbi:PAS domain-containing protein [Oceanobacter mangrovi]|uniref:PAS domain-containing protein n=1 Tax=Oceanobacter mangrovi TaxID=2862510 RepID=UPI001C8D121E|nr:PAS domain-containing protein [Oceanobacter mangrovi]
MLNWLKRLVRPAAVADNSLQQLLDSLDNCVLKVDSQGRLNYANPAWQRLTGLSPQHSSGRPFEEFLHPAERGQWYALLDQHRSNPDAGDYCDPLWLRLLAGEQEPVWCELRVQPLADGSYAVSCYDISAQVESKRRSSATQRGMTALLGRLPVMIYRSRNDRDWTMEFVSEGCFELTGYKAEDVVAMNQHSFGKLIHPADAEYVWQEIQTAIQNRRSFEIHYRLFHKHGHMQYVCEKGAAVYTSSGSVLAIEGVIFAHDNLQIGASTMRAV